MALSEYEKQVLEQMESEFRRADPQLASKMAKPVEPQLPSGSFSARRCALGALIAVAGLAALVAAVYLGYSFLWSSLCAVLGFVLMILGVKLAVSKKKVGRAAAQNRVAGAGANAWARFLADQERRWRDRRGGD